MDDRNKLNSNKDGENDVNDNNLDVQSALELDDDNAWGWVNLDDGSFHMILKKNLFHVLDLTVC